MAKKLNLGSDFASDFAFDVNSILDDLNVESKNDGKPIEIDVNKLKASPYQKFKDRPDEAEALKESIMEIGVITPLLVKEEDGGYVIISGHRRCQAAKQAGLATVPCIIVSPADRWEECRLLGDANLSREKLYPSEKAWGYRYQRDALAHQGKISDDKRETVDIIAEKSDDSKTTIRRLIRLTYLIPDLADMVDDNKLALYSAVALSFLSDDEQSIVYKVIAKRTKKLTIDKASEIQALSGSLTEQKVLDIVNAVKEIKAKEPAANDRFLLYALPEAFSKIPKKKRIQIEIKAIKEYIEKNPGLLD